MSSFYKDLRSNYPNQLDDFKDMNDLDLNTVEELKEWQELIANKDFKNAQLFLSKCPELERTIVNADKINKLQDAVKSMQRYVLLDKRQVILSENKPDRETNQIEGDIWYPLVGTITV